MHSTKAQRVSQNLRVDPRHQKTRGRLTLGTDLIAALSGTRQSHADVWPGKVWLDLYHRTSTAQLGHDLRASYCTRPALRAAPRTPGWKQASKDQEGRHHRMQPYSRPQVRQVARQAGSVHRLSHRVFRHPPRDSEPVWPIPTCRAVDGWPSLRAFRVDRGERSQVTATTIRLAEGSRSLAYALSDFRKPRP